MSAWDGPDWRALKPLSTEQEDVEAIREALDKLDDDGSCMCHDPANTAGYECDWHISQSGLAALNRLAAALERGENEQAWEDMRAYNIRLEERAREAERALAEAREALRRLSTKDFPLANRVYWMREFARAALRPPLARDPEWPLPEEC